MPWRIHELGNKFLFKSKSIHYVIITRFSVIISIFLSKILMTPSLGLDRYVPTKNPENLPRGWMNERSTKKVGKNLQCYHDTMIKKVGKNYLLCCHDTLAKVEPWEDCFEKLPHGWDSFHSWSCRSLQRLQPENKYFFLQEDAGRERTAYFTTTTPEFLIANFHNLK